jgi:diguanylate cyclase (GGDEF)-like protein/PAS domain S-box-containing protein
MIAKETARLFRLITAPFLVVDRLGEVVFASQTLCELLELEKNQLIGQSIMALSADPPEKTSRSLKLFFGSGDWTVGFLSMHKGDGSVVDFPCRGCVVQRPSTSQAPLVAIKLDQRMQFQAFNHKIEELNTEIRHRLQVEGQLRERSAKLEHEIAERKKAERDTAQLSLQNRLILDSAGEGIYGMDIDGRCTFINQAALQLLGFSVEELIGQHGHPKFHHTRQNGQPYPEDECPVHSAIKRGEVTRGSDLYWRKDGRSFPVEFISTPILQAEKVSGAVLTFSDITERKHAEETLSKSENSLRTLIQAIPDLIWMKDLEGVYIACNQRFESFFGASAKDIVGYTDYDFVSRELADSFREHDRIAMMKGSPSVNEEWITFADDGHRELLETTKTPVLDAHGNLIGILGIGHDITSRKRAEMRLMQYKVALDTTHDGFWMVDSQGVLLEVNKAYADIIGYRVDELRGMHISQLESVYHSVDEVKEQAAKIIAKGYEVFETRHRHKDRHDIDVEVSASFEPESQMFVAFCRDITLRKKAEMQIEQLAFYDPLTGLPNRRLLQDRLGQTLATNARSGRNSALLFIDLDNFKTLNDTLGHVIGDLLLQQAAQRLQSCIREGDTVARPGGDEFLVTLNDLSEETIEAATQTESVADKILAVLNQPYLLAGHECHNTSSIGATLFGAQKQSVEDIMKQADIAMYQAKKAGRNTLRFFDPKMQAKINSLAMLEDELRIALVNHEFQLYFQIQVDSARTAFGAEALIRWVHPEHGLVSPAQFIPLAEDTGQIIPIGKWVLETACAQLKLWQQNILTCDLVLAVNVSAKQFRQPDFAAQVLATMKHYAIDPRLLKLELTESMLAENIEETIKTMNQLKESGVRFSLDDFGTGYSSLQYLKRLPLDQVKIDQSFVRDICFDSSDKAIIRTIIAMANSLNLDVIAEGVETEAQRQLLLKKGCNHYQGYLFGKPVPIDQFEAMLKQE